MRTITLLSLLLLAVCASTAQALTLVRLNAPARWKLLEFRVGGMPASAAMLVSKFVRLPALDLFEILNESCS